jgi:two-component system, OmpR family, response regulator VicR
MRRPARLCGAAPPKRWRPRWLRTRQPRRGLAGNADSPCRDQTKAALISSLKCLSEMFRKETAFTMDGMNNGPRVLVVDDETIVCDVLSRYLSREGFAVETAEDGEAAIEAFNDHDLVLLDVMMPKVDGIEVLRRIRMESMTPVIMLTAKAAESERVAGLNLGADDYIVKPFSPAEVVARVRAVLRRSGDPSDEEDEPLEFGDLRIDPRRRVVTVATREIELTPKEFDVLYLLASNEGKVFSRTEILEELWDFAYDGDPSTVTVHIRRVREKTETDPSQPHHLTTVWGVGYRFDP